MPASHPGTGSSLSSLLLAWKSHTRRPKLLAPATTWGTQMKPQVPGDGLAQPHPVQPPGKRTSRWESVSSLSLSKYKNKSFSPPKKNVMKLYYQKYCYTRAFVSFYLLLLISFKFQPLHARETMHLSG